MEVQGYYRGKEIQTNRLISKII